MQTTFDFVNMEYLIRNLYNKEVKTCIIQKKKKTREHIPTRTSEYALFSLQYEHQILM